MASAYGAKLRLGTPVAALRQDADAVTVVTRAGEELEARAAVVTIPVNALGPVELGPALWAGKQRAIAEGQAGRESRPGFTSRTRSRMSSPSHRIAIRSNFLQSEARHPDGGQVVLAFGPDGAALDVKDLDAVRGAVQRLVPELEVLRAGGHN